MRLLETYEKIREAEVSTTTVIFSTINHMIQKTVRSSFELE